MTKQLLLLRLDHIDDEIRQYAAGMKGMCEIPHNSPLVKMDSDAMSELYSRRNHILKEIEEIDEKIAARRKPPWNNWGERVAYYIKMYEFPESYRSDVEECLKTQDECDFQDIEAFGHLLERKIDEECENE